MLRDLVEAVRRNHALEHATVAVMLGRIGPQLRLVGRAVPDGFYIYGDVPERQVATSAQEALQRLQRGEATLAVSPLCGTNLAVAGALAGVTATLASTGSGSRWGAAAGRAHERAGDGAGGTALGRWVQVHLTTSRTCATPASPACAVAAAARGATSRWKRPEARAPAASALVRRRPLARAPVAQPDRAAAF